MLFWELLCEGLERLWARLLWLLALHSSSSSSLLTSSCTLFATSLSCRQLRVVSREEEEEALKSSEALSDDAEEARPSPLPSDYRPELRP